MVPRHAHNCMMLRAIEHVAGCNLKLNQPMSVFTGKLIAFIAAIGRNCCTAFSRKSDDLSVVSTIVTNTDANASACFNFSPHVRSVR